MENSRFKFRAWDEEFNFFIDTGVFVGFDGSSWFNNCGDGEDQMIDQSGKLVIEQSTGLKDKNGKDIFEGDIVKWFGHEVAFGKQIRPGRWMVVGDGYVAPKKVPGNFILDCYHLQNLIDAGYHNVEIVGNIHEHPEILQDV